MVRFKVTIGGFDVSVDDRLFGHLQHGSGFFTGPTTVEKECLVVSSADLIQIAVKADEVKKYGNAIPMCPSCKGTPNFPEQIHNPNEGMQTCQASMHPFNIRNLSLYNLY